MNKFDYENEIYNINLLEKKLKRIQFEKEYLFLIEPSFLEFKKRKKWHKQLNKILEEENINNHKLLIAYTNLEKLFYNQ